MNEPILEALRAEGLDRYDPVRFHFLEAMARRLPTLAPAVRQVLRHRWEDAVEDYAGRARAPHGACSGGEIRAPESPLAQLVRELAARAEAGGAPVEVSSGTRIPEMDSVRRFGEVWSKIAAERQVAQALARGPENAGPLNSHKLMLRSLRLMRALSPDYLRRFVAQMDALLWLEQHLLPAAPPVAKVVRKTRRKP